MSNDNEVARLRTGIARVIDRLTRGNLTPEDSGETVAKVVVILLTDLLAGEDVADPGPEVAKRRARLWAAQHEGGAS